MLYQKSIIRSSTAVPCPELGSRKGCPYRSFNPKILKFVEARHIVPKNQILGAKRDLPQQYFLFFGHTLLCLYKIFKSLSSAQKQPKLKTFSLAYCRDKG